jgi:hypothetical protein
LIHRSLFQNKHRWTKKVLLLFSKDEFRK